MERIQPMKTTVVWITGLSGAGKTTVGEALVQKCKEAGIKTGFLDGDVVRASLDKPLGFTLQDREKFVNTVVYMACNMIEYQRAGIVVVALISPLCSMRDNARHIIEKYANAKFVEVFLDTPLWVCEERDPKGLYKKARAGEIKDFTGIDSPYERPTLPEVHLHHETTLGKMTVEKAVDVVYNRISNTTTQ